MSALERLIHMSDVTPEGRFMAGMLISALETARKGDELAYEWVRACGCAYLAQVCPSTIDPVELHAALLARLPERHSPEVNEPPEAADDAALAALIEPDGICRFYEQAALPIGAPV